MSLFSTPFKCFVLSSSHVFRLNRRDTFPVGQYRTAVREIPNPLSDQH